MSRYFIELAYKGTNYAGFQIQQNANSIQAEVEKALAILFKTNFQLTCSSRTDAGVHALKNYFHFDTIILPGKNKLENVVYRLNAILPADIAVRQIFRVKNDAHCRFDAVSREYNYFIYQGKQPFLMDRAYYYPYKLNINQLQQAAEAVMNHSDFTSFSKRNTQVKSFDCAIKNSNWYIHDEQIVYNVVSNRFLRGMVKGLVGTMLRVGTGKITLDGLFHIFQQKDCSKADFSVPPHGLFLADVVFPESICWIE